MHSQVHSSCMLTVANGVDNITIYLTSLLQVRILCLWFYSCNQIGSYCLVGYEGQFLKDYGKIIVPFCSIFIYFVILSSNFSIYSLNTRMELWNMQIFPFSRLMFVQLTAINDRFSLFIGVLFGFGVNKINNIGFW